MVQKIFKVVKSSTSVNGYDIEDQSTGKVLNLPEVVYNELNGKYITADKMIDKIDTLQIALAGVTDSLNLVPDQEYSYEQRSVLKTIRLKSNLGTIDDEIDEDLESVTDYEQYHTIEMNRDKVGNDNTIHAYLQTPKNGKLRCQFDKSVRLDAKRNNIKYWVDDYKIVSGSNGGEFVRIIGNYVEIM